MLEVKMSKSRGGREGSGEKESNKLQCLDDEFKSQVMELRSPELLRQPSAPCV